MTDPPAAGDLRTQIAAALLGERITGNVLELADLLMPVITEALTEAPTTCPCAPFVEQLATAWDEGAQWSAVRNGYSRKIADRANPYSAAGGDPT